MPAAINWTPAISEAFVDGILAGIAISQLCVQLGISEASFYRHRIEDAEFESVIARAQEAASEANIDRTEELARTATVENWQLIQFQCRNAQWIAGKRKAKKYGEKIEHTGDLSIKTVLVPSPTKDASARPATTPAFDDEE